MEEKDFLEKEKEGEIEEVKEEKPETPETPRSPQSLLEANLEDYIAVLEELRKNGILKYYSIDPPNQSQPASSATWEDWDLSAYCPAGAKYAEIWMKNNSANLMTMGVRKNGTTIDRTLIFSAGSDKAVMVWTVELDADRIIERYGGDGAGAKGYFSVIGYWK